MLVSVSEYWSHNTTGSITKKHTTTKLRDDRQPCYANEQLCEILKGIPRMEFPLKNQYYF